MFLPQPVSFSKFYKAQCPRGPSNASQYHSLSLDKRLLPLNSFLLPFHWPNSFKTLLKCQVFVRPSGMFSSQKGSFYFWAPHLSVSAPIPRCCYLPDCASAIPYQTLRCAFYLGLFSQLWLSRIKAEFTECWLNDSLMTCMLLTNSNDELFL